MLRDGILVLRNVVEPRICEMLSMIYEVHRQQGSQRDYNGNRVVHVTDLGNNRPAQVMLGNLARASKGYVREWYGEEHDVESVFLARLSSGHVMEPHYDNTKLDGVVPNHTPHRSHSSLFYLSEAFEGGEIVFPNQGIQIKPEIGMYISFPAYPPYLHRVNEVRGGYRYTVPVWFTQTAERALRNKEVQRA